MLQAESVKQPGALAQYVDAPKLLETLFAPECRPSLRWLREQQAARKIPSVKIGRLVFFDPAACKAALDARNQKAAR
jgi:uncharacterized protein YbaR (Trm112 family)